MRLRQAWLHGFCQTPSGRYGLAPNAAMSLTAGALTRHGNASARSCRPVSCQLLLTTAACSLSRLGSRDLSAAAHAKNAVDVTALKGQQLDLDEVAPQNVARGAMYCHKCKNADAK